MTTPTPEPLGALRDLRAALADAARRYPHLLAPAGGSDTNADAWERELVEAQVGEAKKQVAFRLPAELLERIDAYADGVHSRTGVETSRTAATAALLTMALDLLDTVDADPLLTGEPGTVRDLVTLALEGVSAARGVSS